VERFLESAAFAHLTQIGTPFSYISVSAPHFEHLSRCCSLVDSRHERKNDIESAFVQVENADDLRVACLNVGHFDFSGAFVQVENADDLRVACFNVGYRERDWLRGLCRSGRLRRVGGLRPVRVGRGDR
jgi:hypothetical protein